MQAPAPHYLLFTDSVGRTCESSKWRFVLQPTGGGERIVASDAEADADGMRLALLAVVRGLEALDGPSRVTLLVANRFVRRGIRRDLAQWRERGWRWERFGQLVPIRDLDLWQRVDRAWRFTGRVLRLERGGTGNRSRPATRPILRGAACGERRALRNASGAASPGAAPIARIPNGDRALRPQSNSRFGARKCSIRSADFGRTALSRTA